MSTKHQYRPAYLNITLHNSQVQTTLPATLHISDDLHIFKPRDDIAVPPIEPGETLYIPVFLTENRFNSDVFCRKVKDGKPYEGLCDGPSGEINREDWEKYYKNFETTFTIYAESYPALDTEAVMTIDNSTMLHCSKYGPVVCHVVCTGADCHQAQECPQCYYYDITELGKSKKEFTIRPSQHWPPQGG